LLGEPSLASLAKLDAAVNAGVIHKEILDPLKEPRQMVRPLE
jgi:hypothetical protein